MHPVKRLHFTRHSMLIAAITLTASCGSGSGSNTNNDSSLNGSTDDATTVTFEDGNVNDIDSVSITDDNTNDGSNAGTDSTDSTDSTDTDLIVSTEGNTTTDTVIPDDASNSVCGETSNSFSYAIFSNGSNDFGYAIETPAAGYGWNGSSFCDLDNSVGITGVAALIPRSDMVPVIDGIPDDPQWTNVSATTSIINGVLDESITRNLLESNVAGYQDGSRAGDWVALHDNEYLYIRYVARHEASGSGNNQIFRDSEEPRDDDSIEIFIDSDNSKGSSYDGINDFHVTIAFLDPDSEFHYGPNSAVGLQLDLATATTGSSSVISSWYEVQINLASAGIVVGQPFGLEVQLNDDDNGGARDAKFSWFETTGSVRAASEPRLFGTALLTSCASGSDCGTEQLLTPLP